MISSEISLWIKKILILIAILGWGYILYTLQNLLFILMISGFFTILINPLVDILERYHIPSWLTVIGVYIVVIILASIVIGSLVPIVIGYVSDTVNQLIFWVNQAQGIYINQWISGFHFHPYIERGVIFLLGEENIEHTFDIVKQNAGNIQSMISWQISSITSGWLTLVTAISGTVANWALVWVTTFLMVLERRSIGNFILEISPNNLDIFLRTHYKNIQNVCTAWIRATLILSLSIFSITYIGLSLVEMVFGFSTEKTFTLALISGIMEFIPYVGPLIALIPALIIGLWLGWKAAVIITLLYIVIQQLENNILVPYVMSKSLNLSPFLVFFVMLVGASLGGIVGIILAIPIAGIAHVIYTEYQNKKHHSTHEKQPKKSPKTLPIIAQNIDTKSTNTTKWKKVQKENLTTA
jgi:predicted PurR-regulated permease PerM